MEQAGERVVALAPDEARYVDDQVARGHYASARDVVRAAVHALQDRDAAFENWLRDEVAPIYDAMKADPSRGIAASQVERNFQAYRTARTREQRGA